MTAKMETPFYHDDSPAIHGFSQFPEYERYAGNKMLMCKKAMSVSVASHHFAGSGAAGARGSNPSNLGLANSGPLPTPSASSADMNMLKLASPDLEHLIIQSNQGLVAGGPLSNPANPFIYRNQATNEQEGFADGFVKALADQRNLMSAGDVPIYTNLGSYNQGQLAYSAAPMTYGGGSGHNAVGGAPQPHTRGLDAPQTVPEVPHLPGDPTSPPSLSPIDLETQERIKAERKKLRNRIAASKCRKRKLERISRLEEKVKILKSQNSDLASTASMLREQVSQLKQKVMSHVTNGCQIAVGSPGKAGGRGCGAASEDSSC